MLWTYRALSNNIKTKLDSLQRSGQFRYDADKRRFIPVWQNVVDHPWAFFGCSVGARNCFLWHKVMFNHFGLVPSFCRFHCYKIVAKPKDADDLIRVFHMANAIPFILGSRVLTIIPGKAGIDRRVYTDNPYTAFWYANGLEDARHCYALVKEALEKVNLIDNLTSLVIKRSCTEFEMARGQTDTPFWQSMSEEETLLEQRLMDIFLVEPEDCAPQANWHINLLIESWLDFARTHGDLSGDRFYNIQSFKPVTYHETKQEEK